MTEASSLNRYQDLPRRQGAILLGSILVVALCGIVYELIIGTVSSYLLGNSVYQFSLTIGFFMFAMGVGSYVSRFINGNLIQAFVRVEIILALVGGLCSISLFMLFPMAPWFYTVGMFTFISAIGFLVGLEIPLLTRVLSEGSTVRESISGVLSLDYLGALLGSVMFPLLLLPSLGLISSSFAIGLTNAAVALLNVLWLRDHLDAPRRMMGYVLAAVALLFGLTLSAGWITAFAQDHLYFDRIVWRKQSQYQTLVVTNTWKTNDVRLYIDGHLQFSEADEYRYHEALVHPVMSWGKPAKNVLVLGGGDGLAIREILKHPSVERIDLVDLDPAMTDLGRDFAPVVRLNKGSMQASQLHVYNQDAFLFVKETDQRYDRIIIDFPDPHNEALSKLYSVEFYAMVAAVLTEDGTLVTQSSSPFFSPHTYWTVSETLKAVFPEVANYQIPIPSFGIWGFNLASRTENQPQIPFPEDLRSLKTKDFEAAKVFATDLLPQRPVQVNSIFSPVIYQEYALDLAQ
ncbi:MULTISPECIES: polyamine aminopropyltransferase [unclassified Leisingera]|uniref:polyamine aminopropyltransferase n=1 Tax=unclassified Leisingera TaxID=2614906 RepID=UPI001010AED7|nr:MULTISPECIES: polyamine aminopropyltransferase [unclassified Leisingera]MCF6433818.1 polyamine aminopropyltransferase [Leisingera sp. MMG026]QAX29099.1 polyamine aminopropyltransferase [Leisingera sp. NJS204]